MRILKRPDGARAVLVGFASSEDAGECVSKIIGAGIIPGGMEMMDRPAIHAVEEFVHAGYPLDVEALLIVEVDGPQAEVDHLIARIEDDRKSLPRRDLPRVALRGRAAAVLGRAQGGVSGGRTHLAGLLLHGRHHSARAAAAGAQAHARAVRTIRARASPMSSTPATAILHPLILYDANKPGELERTEKFGADILGFASKSAACSPASTASGWRSAT